MIVRADFFVGIVSSTTKLLALNSFTTVNVPEPLEVKIKFVAGSNAYNLTPVGWDTLKETLSKVKQIDDSDDYEDDELFD